ncbi:MULTISPECIES: MarR family winged helix-turn-helix transcriptional regulator [Pseudonocardia]|jgi:DNA-binding MarR family transcriptional regulator|uniref:MarR family winged helix-turn-helix transcriptional regulator n=1 Tax=Pseudonocardia TaxID=1847 RepID=UPI000CD00DBF|nr:MarR family transcriptional regulator [Pseudonocardia dioxanivorans]
MDDGVAAYATWSDVGATQRDADFRAYAFNIAEARYVMRRVTRIINEEAKKRGFDPLQHQALLQIYGVREGVQLTISGLGERLDVPAAFASRLVRALEGEGYVVRTPSEQDRRVTFVEATDAGVRMLREIDEEVHRHVAFFQHSLRDEQRIAALSIFAFYVGIDADSPIADALRAEREAPDAV